MEIKYTKKRIEFEKNLNSLDNFVIRFTSILNKLSIKYVIVSGYVSILFGRNRTSEDVDLIIEKINLDKFRALWVELYREFECLNTDNPKTAYNEYLLNETSVRFSKKGMYLPNMEVKFPNSEDNPLDIVSLKERKEVLLNNNKLFISPLELQMAFKFFLGSEKDIEDALYLYEMFKNQINLALLYEFSRKLKIEAMVRKYLK